MANETLYSDYVTYAAYVVANAAPYLRTNVVGLNLVPTKNFVERTPGNPGSASLDFGVLGGLSMSVVAEASGATKQRYQETKVTLTAQKAVTYVELTDEGQIFGNDRSDPEFMAQEAGRAAADRYDTDLFALLDSLSTNVIGTTNVALTVAELKKGPIKLRLSKTSGPIVYVLHPTQVGDVQDSIITASAPVWGNGQTNLDVLGGQPPAANGFVGNIFGVPAFESTNMKSINSNVDWCGGCFSVQWTFCAGILGRFRAKFVPVPSTMTDQMAFAMYYDQDLWKEATGCKVVSKK